MFRRKKKLEKEIANEPEKESRRPGIQWLRELKALASERKPRSKRRKAESLRETYEELSREEIEVIYSASAQADKEVEQPVSCYSIPRHHLPASRADIKSRMGIDKVSSSIVSGPSECSVGKDSSEKTSIPSTDSRIWLPGGGGGVEGVERPASRIAQRATDVADNRKGKYQVLTDGSKVHLLQKGSVSGQYLVVARLEKVGKCDSTTEMQPTKSLKGEKFECNLHESRELRDTIQESGYEVRTFGGDKRFIIAKPSPAYVNSKTEHTTRIKNASNVTTGKVGKLLQEFTHKTKQLTSRDVERNSKCTSVSSLSLDSCGSCKSIDSQKRSTKICMGNQRSNKQLVKMNHYRQGNRDKTRSELLSGGNGKMNTVLSGSSIDIIKGREEELCSSSIDDCEQKQNQNQNPELVYDKSDRTNGESKRLSKRYGERSSVTRERNKDGKRVVIIGRDKEYDKNSNDIITEPRKGKVIYVDETPPDMCRTESGTRFGDCDTSFYLYKGQKNRPTSYDRAINRYRNPSDYCTTHHPVPSRREGSCSSINSLCGNVSKKHIIKSFCPNPCVAHCDSPCQSKYVVRNSNQVRGRDDCQTMDKWENARSSTRQHHNVKHERSPYMECSEDSLSSNYKMRGGSRSNRNGDKRKQYYPVPYKERYRRHSPVTNVIAIRLIKGNSKMTNYFSSSSGESMHAATDAMRCVKHKKGKRAASKDCSKAEKPYSQVPTKLEPAKASPVLLASATTTSSMMQPSLLLSASPVPSPSEAVPMSPQPPLPTCSPVTKDQIVLFSFEQRLQGKHRLTQALKQVQGLPVLVLKEQTIMNVLERPVARRSEHYMLYVNLSPRCASNNPKPLSMYSMHPKPSTQKLQSTGFNEPPPAIILVPPPWGTYPRSRKQSSQRYNSDHDMPSWMSVPKDTYRCKAYALQSGHATAPSEGTLRLQAYDRLPLVCAQPSIRDKIPQLMKTWFKLEEPRCICHADITDK